MANMQQAQGHQPAPQPQPRDKHGEFQRTKPPTFSHSIEPMDADDWLKTIKKKLQVAQCNNREKVLFASHQLEGPAADWWDAYVEAHEEPESINWQEFKSSFRSHHVPLGVMKLKKKEIEYLKQGSMTVSEYVTHFTQLSCYAPDNMDTNEKKQGWFLNGLNDGLNSTLEAQDFINFQDMVDKALVLETRRGIMEQKRKMQCIGSQGSNIRFRVGSSSQRPVFRPGQQSGQPRVQAAGQGFQTPQHQIERPNFQSPRSALPPPQRNSNTQNSGVVGPCYSCGQSGHYANRCPRKQANWTLALGTNQNINRNANNSASTPAWQNQARAHVNHVVVEDAQAAPDVIIGMILINDNNTIVLFDSGASHSFIATNFVQKHNLPISMLKNQMIVSSPGGDMHARHVCPKVNILIRGVEFIANLIVLESKGIDVILGMDWLSKRK
jgi:hypothetical protein